jgi:hypothetical protein
MRSWTVPQKNTYRPIVLVHEFAEPTIGRTNMVMSHY